MTISQIAVAQICQNLNTLNVPLKKLKTEISNVFLWLDEFSFYELMVNYCHHGVNNSLTNIFQQYEIII